MLSERHMIHDKYRAERSMELAVACDISSNCIAAVLYDLGMERRYARSVMFGTEITPQNAAEELTRSIVTVIREYSVKPRAVKRIGIAAPVYVESELERTLSAADMGLEDSSEILFVPYISAGINGRFTASLLTLPNEGNWMAASLGKELCVACKKGDEFFGASYPLEGAFDGTALESGMPAENGAIDTVRREGDKTIAYEVTGDCDSIGISPCGALTAAVVMQREGILDSDGIMTDRDYFYIGEDFFISQNDIRTIQADKARAAAALELLPDIGGQMFFSGEPFSDADGFRALLEIGAIPERFGNAAFCRNSTEQGIIAFLEDENARARAFELVAVMKDISQDKLLKYDGNYLNNLNF